MSNDNTVIAEAYRLAELRLEWQFNAAIAADQRAIGLAGMFVASAAILAGLAGNSGLPIAFQISAAILTIAAFMVATSARPKCFHAPGAKFSDLSQDIAEARTLDQVRAELGVFHDKHIDDNDRSMKDAKKAVQIALKLAGVSLIVAILGPWAWALLKIGCDYYLSAL